MSFTQAITSAYAQYATWGGRARRSEYWWFVLFSTLAYLVLLLVSALAIAGLQGATGSSTAGGVVVGVLVLAYLAGVAIPQLAVLVRRLHDTDRTGWWYWISLVPFGSIALLVFLCLDSTPGPNRYGPSPAPGRPLGHRVADQQWSTGSA